MWKQVQCIENVDTSHKRHGLFNVVFFMQNMGSLKLYYIGDNLKIIRITPASRNAFILQLTKILLNGLKLQETKSDV